LTHPGASDGAGAAGNYALRLHHVTKRYPGTLALDDVSLALRRGEIHALVGGNGSGKSTAIKILAGVVSADAGDVELAGERYPLSEHNVDRARAADLRFVHQQSSTFPDLTVAENLSLGRGFERGFAGRIQWSRVRARTREVLQRFGIDERPDTPMRQVRPASQMMIAIARALQDVEDANDGVLVLDEPTAGLPLNEVTTLLDALRRYASEGQTVLYVTHRLNEVTDVADEATVLRDGRVAVVLDKSELSHDNLVRAITGKALALEAKVAAAKPAVVSDGETQAENVTLRGVGDGTQELTIRVGEVTGIAGLLGSGRSGILRALFGLAPFEHQDVQIDGETVRLDSPSQAVAAGVAYVPEDRASASFPEESLARNLSVTVLDEYSRFGWFDGRAERARARELIEAFGVRAASERSTLSSLSGGNAQKVILARWMQRDPRLLLLDEPTQGVDVGARAEIHALVRRAAAGGTAVVFVSSDFEELEIIADRVLVVADGQVAEEVVGDDITADKLDSLVYAHGGSRNGGE
jgi:ribose transport system ATP-binding protein